MSASAQSVRNSAHIHRAAIWLATGGAKKGEAVVPQLQREFSLSAKEAVDAIREANLMRARSH